jgi:uncharacterized circularly permuted ATP-grasp superfamily protein
VAIIRSPDEILPPRASPDLQPNVRLLTPGITNSAYLNIHFWRLMGIPLVEGRDLVVDNHEIA